jgi:SAM-dependent methyltransferase
VPDPLSALSEARRVTKPGGIVYVLVWGREEHTELVAVLKALHPLVPPRPAGGPGPFALSPPGVLEELMTRAGLTPAETGYIELPYEYPDQATMLRAQCSSGPAVLAARTSGHETVEAAIVDALAPYRTASGGYRIETEYRFLTAAA